MALNTRTTTKTSRQNTTRNTQDNPSTKVYYKETEKERRNAKKQKKQKEKEMRGDERTSRDERASRDRGYTFGRLSRPPILRPRRIEISILSFTGGPPQKNTKSACFAHLAIDIFHMQKIKNSMSLDPGFPGSLILKGFSHPTLRYHPLFHILYWCRFNHDSIHIEPLIKFTAV